MPSSEPKNIPLNGLFPLPPGLETASVPHRAKFWKLVGQEALRLKRGEIESGVDIWGNKFQTVKRQWGDPTPLLPHGQASRTYRLLSLNSTARGATLFWRAGGGRVPWPKILGYHAYRHGPRNLPVRNEIGLSPRSVEALMSRSAEWQAGYEAGLAASKIKPGPSPKPQQGETRLERILRQKKEDQARQATLAEAPPIARDVVNRILELSSQGKSAAAIAKDLKISVSTVYKYRGSAVSPPKPLAPQKSPTPRVSRKKILTPEKEAEKARKAQEAAERKAERERAAAERKAERDRRRAEADAKKKAREEETRRKEEEKAKKKAETDRKRAEREAEREKERRRKAQERAAKGIAVKPMPQPKTKKIVPKKETPTIGRIAPGPIQERIKQYSVGDDKIKSILATSARFKQKILEIEKKEHALSEEFYPLLGDISAIEYQMGKATKKKKADLQKTYNSLIAKRDELKALRESYTEEKGKVAEEARRSYSEILRVKDGLEIGHEYLPEGETSARGTPFLEPTASNKRTVQTSINFMSSITAAGDQKSIDYKIGIGGKDFRAYHHSGTIGVGTEDDPDVIIHELGHAFEYEVSQGGDRASKLVNEFLKYRVGSEEATNISEKFGLGAKNEMGRKDRFDQIFDEYGAYYTGRKYPSGATEIMAMGVQQLYNDAALFAEKDPEYFKFVIGMLDGSLR